MTQQLTREQAVAFYESGKWKTLTPLELAVFQLEQECLCAPFGNFHHAVETVLGRPVWTHEFAKPECLRAELAGKASPPTFDEILAQLQLDTVLLVKP